MKLTYGKSAILGIALMASTLFAMEPCSINNLPDEELVKIFSYISKVNEIEALNGACLRFHRICDDGPLNRFWIRTLQNDLEICGRVSHKNIPRYLKGWLAYLQAKRRSNQEAMIEAIRYNRIGLVEALLILGTKINTAYAGLSPLSWAMQFDRNGSHSQMIQFLRLNGAQEVHFHNFDTSQIASFLCDFAGREDLKHALKATGIWLQRSDVQPDRPGRQGDTPLMIATRTEKLPLVRLLVESRCKNIEERISNINKALAIAIEKRNMPIVRLLLENYVTLLTRNLV